MYTLSVVTNTHWINLESLSTPMLTFMSKYHCFAFFAGKSLDPACDNCFCGAVCCDHIGVNNRALAPLYGTCSQERVDGVINLLLQPVLLQQAADCDNRGLIRHPMLIISKVVQQHLLGILIRAATTAGSLWDCHCCNSRIYSMLATG